MLRLLLCGFLLLAPAAQGQVPVGQTPIGQLPAAHGQVIAGEITAVFGNKFVLRDATGQVLVDTGPRWFRQHRFTVGERVTVTGEMDDDDFDAWRVTRADGSVLVVQSGRGPPPWAAREDR